MKHICAIWSPVAQIGSFCHTCQTSAWAVAGALLPAGSQTLAFYQTDVAHVLWRMCAPSGNLKGHLFSISVEMCGWKNAGSVIWDLLLDIWISSDGVVEVLDREDVDECYREGKLCEADLKAIAAEEKRIVTHWPVLVREMDALLGDLLMISFLLRAVE